MEPTPKIYAAIANIMADVKAIPKAQKNTQQNFMYRGIDDIMNDLHDIFARHKVFILPNVIDVQENMIPTGRDQKPTRFVKSTMIYSFIAEDGSKVDINIIGEAMDSGDKAINKSYAIALKYALLQMLLIPTAEEKDPDGSTYTIDEGNSKQPQQPPKQPQPQKQGEKPKPKEKIAATPEKIKEWKQAIKSGKAPFKSIEEVKKCYTLTEAQEKTIVEALKKGTSKDVATPKKLEEWLKAIAAGKAKFSTIEEVKSLYELTPDQEKAIIEALKKGTSKDVATPKKLEEWLKAIAAGKAKFSTIEEVKSLYELTPDQEKAIIEALSAKKDENQEESPKAEPQNDKLPVKWGSRETQKAQRAIQVAINKGELTTLEAVTKIYSLDKKATEIIKKLLKLKATEKIK